MNAGQIPKIIHYCWFGKKKKPDIVKTCIDSWKHFCPDYEIREWNEENYDVQKNQYMFDAYKAEKWAFVTDYVRLDVVYDFGGFYLDTDVELLRPLDTLRYYSAVMGFERGKYVSSGLICGARQGHDTIRELRDLYDTLSFLQSDGKYNLTPCPKYSTDFFLGYGLHQNNQKQICKDVTIFPTDFFDPLDFLTQELRITSNTYSIHHASQLWKDKETIAATEKERRVYQLLGKTGWRVYHGMKIWSSEGFLSLVKKIITLF